MRDGPDALREERVRVADAVISVPLNPGFASLNLAQAVLLLGYEWYRGEKPPRAVRLERNRGRLADARVGEVPVRDAASQR